MAAFYQLHLGRIPARFHEAESEHPVGRFCELALLRAFKLFQVKSASIGGEPTVGSLEEFRIPAEDLPENIWDIVQGPGTELGKLGFGSNDSAFYRFQCTAGGPATMYRLVLRHGNGPAFVRLDVRFVKKQVKVRAISFLTPLKGGRWIITGNGFPSPYPESWVTSEVQDRPISETWAVHGAEIQARRNQLQPVAASTAESMESYHGSIVQFMEVSGFWVEMDAADVVVGTRPAKELHSPTSETVATPESETQPEWASASAIAPQPAKGLAGAHPGLHATGETDAMSQDERLELAMVDVSDKELAVIAEQVEYLDKGGVTWRQGIVLALFFMMLIGPWVWLSHGMNSLGRIAIIIGVIFFHEAGHFLAMKLFRFRNVRMLAVPLVGGAVASQNRDAPGWQKVMVALAGPLPGIVAGLALGVWALVADISVLRELSMWLLLINALNLLPVTPLDGGVIANELIFKRSAVLEMIALVLGALGMLLFGSLLVPGKVAALLALALFGALPVIYRNGKVAKALRNHIVLDLGREKPGINSGTLRDIVRGINAAWPRAITPRTYATLAIDVYERACSRIPNVFASLFFMGVHTTALMLATLAAFTVMAVHGMGGTQQMFAIAEAAEAGDWDTAIELLPGEWAEEMQAEFLAEIAAEEALWEEEMADSEEYADLLEALEAAADEYEAEFGPPNGAK